MASFAVDWAYTGDVAHSVARESEFKSEDTRFDPLARQGEGQFFCPPDSCADLFAPGPISYIYGTHPLID